MLRSLKEVQSDDSVVGFYQATTLGAFFNQSLVETQAIHQEKLRHGGVVVIHGKTIGNLDLLGGKLTVRKISLKLREGTHLSVPSD